MLNWEGKMTIENIALTCGVSIDEVKKEMAEMGPSLKVEKIHDGATIRIKGNNVSIEYEDVKYYWIDNKMKKHVMCKQDGKMCEIEYINGDIFSIKSDTWSGVYNEVAGLYTCVPNGPNPSYWCSEVVELSGKNAFDVCLEKMIHCVENYSTR